MRKILSLCAAAAALLAAGSAHALAVASPVAVPADVGDDSLVRADAGGASAAPTDFTMTKFNSCGGLENVMRDYLSGAFLRYSQNWQGQPYYRGGPVMLEGAVMDKATSVAAPSAAAGNAVSAPVSATDYSSTNVQVLGVDEGEAVKTDGTNIYYYDATDRAVYVVKAYPATAMDVLKKIKMPDSFSEPELYVADGKLTIVSGKYVTDLAAGQRWVDGGAKTVVAVYDLADPSHPKLQRYVQLDGSYSKSRRVGGYLYVVSQSSVRVPYDTYTLKYFSDTGFHPDAAGFGSAVQALTASDVLPRKTEIRLAAPGQGNVTVNGKPVDYRAESAPAAGCASVEYVLPDQETLKKYDLSPEFVTVTAVNLADATAPATSKVVFGSLNEIYLSQDSLYLASHVYRPNPWRCPPGAYCMMPYFPAQESTLLHKFSINASAVAYQATAMVPGSPLSQYSMDQDASGNFRIVTKSWTPDRQTSVYVLDPSLKKVGELTGLAPKEDLKASRFVGDRLYLVTFQQIDPLFVVSLADPKNPTVMGELKIPGFSTYLHPYDANTLIGLGYGTMTNQWGGTQTAGLKIDLYDVSDIKNPKQKFTFDLGDQGSSSDALNDPRLFVWNAQRKTLLLPVTLFWKKDATSYENKDAFQGVVALKIDKDAGISELARMTHIDTAGLHDKRVADCAQYLKKPDVTTPACRTLLDGTTLCTDPSTVNRWVPEYCYADAIDGSYFANQIWNWNRDFAKRTVFLDNWAYTVADSGVKSWDMDKSFSPVSGVTFAQ